MGQCRAISALLAVGFSCLVQSSGRDPPDIRQENHPVLSHLGSKSGYTPPGAAEEDLGAVIPESCEVMMVTGVMRHGSDSRQIVGFSASPNSAAIPLLSHPTVSHRVSPMESSLLLVASTVCGLRTPTPEPPSHRSRNPGKKDIAAFTALGKM